MACDPFVSFVVRMKSLWQRNYYEHPIRLIDGET